MTVYIEKPAQNLREELAALRAKVTAGLEQQQFWFAADGTATDFTMSRGWKPLHVFNAGALQKEGSGDEYTVTYDGFLYTVSFNVAPTSGNDVGVIGVRA
jgi:hypothetical protein